MPKMPESQTEVEELQAESDQKIGWRVPLPENALGWLYGCKTNPKYNPL